MSNIPWDKFILIGIVTLIAIAPTWWGAAVDRWTDKVRGSRSW